METISKINKKIEYLTQLAINQYNIDENIVVHAAKKAKKVNEWANENGFSETDIFMSEGGVFVLVAYKKENSIEITILDDNTYDIFIENNGIKLLYKQHQCKFDIQALLHLWESKLL